MECLEIVEVSEDALPFLLIGVEVLMCLFAGKPGFLFVIAIKGLGLYFDIGAVQEAQEVIDYYNDPVYGGAYTEVDTSSFQLVVDYVIFQRVSAIVITIIVLIFSKLNFDPMLDVPESVEKKDAESDKKSIKMKWISAKRNLLFGSAWTGGDAISKLFSVAFKESEEEALLPKTPSLPVAETTGETTDVETGDAEKEKTTTDETDDADAPAGDDAEKTKTDETGKTDNKTTDDALKKTQDSGPGGCFGPGFYKLLQTKIGRVVCFLMFLTIFIVDIWFLFTLLTATTSYIATGRDSTISGVQCEVSDDWILSIYWMVLSGLVGHLELWIVTFGIFSDLVSYFMYRSKGKEIPKKFSWLPLILSGLVMLIEIIVISILLADFAAAYNEFYTLFGDHIDSLGCGRRR